LKNAFFDWYQCSLALDPDDLIPAICDEYAASTRHGKPQPPYTRCLEFVPLGSKKNDLTVVPFASIHYGGINEKILLRSTSDNAQRFSEFVRNRWPNHSVSRLDVALDFREGPDFFNDMAEWLIDYASKNRLTVSYAGDWSQGVSGRTLYVGSRKSPVFVRLYEKGLEQLKRGNSSAPVDWVRFEAEIKPSNKVAKINMSLVSPSECLGSSKLLRDFGALLGDNYAPLRVGTVRKMTDFDRTFSHLCYQYADLFKDLVEQESGDLESAMSRILHGVEAEKIKRQNIRDSVKQYSFRDLRRAGLTAPACSVPSSDLLPVPQISSLSPALIAQYPSIMCGLIFRPVSHIPAVRQ
jgi:hypothetical protein